MDQRRALMAIGAIIIILLIVVFGVAYFSSKSNSARNTRRTTGTQTASPSPGVSVPIASVAPSGSPGGSQPSQEVAGQKTFSGQAFQFRYPSSWGLLKCNNSANIEFDPENATDQLNVSCNMAVKPVTVLVTKQRLNCAGQTIQLGYNQVIKSKADRRDGGITYRWCINGPTTSLDITHRKTDSGAQATSKTDYSTFVEQMITTLTFDTGS